MHLIPLKYVSPPSTRTRHSTRSAGQDNDDEDGFPDDGDAEGWITVGDALRMLQCSDNTRAPKDIEDAVWRRIAG